MVDRSPEDADESPGAGGPLFRALPDPAVGYAAADPEPVVRAVNPAFVAVFGSDPAHQVGRPLSAGLVGEAGGPDPDDIADRIARDEAVDAVVGHPVEGETRHFRCRSIPADGSGPDRSPLDGFVVYTDVTERERERRALDDRVERVEAFMKVVTHDLRNPMEVARLRTKSARDTGEAVHFEKALGAVERMDDIIESARSMVLEGERLTPAPVDLDAAVRDAWDAVDTGDATLAAADLGGVRADPSHLQHLLENLFRNAVEHGSTDSRPASDDGTGRDGAGRDAGSGLTVRIGRLDEEGFYVADDGVGVPESRRDRVFEPRYSTADDGTGYGLAIVERIAAAHGWDVRLVPSADGGARFEFTGVEPADTA